MYALINSTILTGPSEAAALNAEFIKLEDAKTKRDTDAVNKEQDALSKLISSIGSNDNVYPIYADCQWRSTCADVPAIDPCDAQPGSSCGEYAVPSRHAYLPHCTTYPGGPDCPSELLTYDFINFGGSHYVSYITTYPSCKSITFGYKVPRIMRLQAFASDGEVLAGTYLQIEFQSNPKVPYPTGTGGCNAVAEATAQVVTGATLGGIAAAMAFSVVLAPIGALIAFWAGVIPAAIGVVCAAVAPQ